MKKIILTISLLLSLCLMLGSCSAFLSDKPTKPIGSRLDLWVGDDVSNYDFSEHEKVKSDTDLDIYYGKKYHSTGTPGTDSYEEPNEYVKYVISSNKVIAIIITDPLVKVWELGSNCDKYDFIEYFESEGYDVDDLAAGDPQYDCRLSATKGRFSVKLKRHNGINEMQIIYDALNENFN